MFREIGVPELLIILVIILLLFGVGRVSQIGKELGSAISSFRKGLSEGGDDSKVAPGKDEAKKA
jgi:sec-independent protein translocase protein TatA